MGIQTPTWYRDVYPYEIHLTVNSKATEHFKETCALLGVKPILIEMQLKEGGTAEDLMCSFKWEASYESTMVKARDLARFFRHLSYKVIRTKIETVPWHPTAPLTIGSSDKMENRYFEAHVGIVVFANPEDRLLKDLNEVAICCKAHKSKNLFKECDNGDHIQMYTIRNYRSLESFNFTLNYFLKVLEDLKINTERVVTEFAIYDSNVSHDEDWIGSNS